jgi:hypothetical protein
MEKIINKKYLVVSYFYDNEWHKFSFRIFKHKNSSFFKRYSKVIEFTIFYRNVIIEF